MIKFNTFKKKKKNNIDYWITTGWEGEEILVPVEENQKYFCEQDAHNILLDKDVDDNLFGQSDEQIVSEINKKGSIK